jgi:hypothetical protein
MEESHRSWAHETFGDAQLGNRSRSRRLVQMATRVAESPAGTVTAVFADGAEREGAFRFLSSAAVRTQAVIDSVGRATLRACRGRVYCPVDGTSLLLSDRAHARDVGCVGAWSHSGRGLQALTALAVDRDGAPVGALGVHFWARKERSRRNYRKLHRSLEGETAHVVNFLTHLDDLRLQDAPDLDVWYQFDRGFDAWPVFQLAKERKLSLTVRSSSERQLTRQAGRPQRYLKSTIRRAPVMHTYLLDVPPRPGRCGRVAVLDVRVARVSLALGVARDQREPVEVTAVSVKETGYAGADGLHWLLLTTVPVVDSTSADDVIDGYARRWRIEDLHRAWKNGWCRVEQTQLRSRDALVRWATIHLAVAARATRLTHLARTEPSKASSTEFSRDEIDAVLLLKKKRAKYRMGEDPPLGDLVRLIADLGGYTGKSSGGPPGATVIGRGLDKIASLAEGLRLLREL